jgi:hypothetical protein
MVLRGTLTLVSSAISVGAALLQLLANTCCVTPTSAEARASMLS